MQKKISFPARTLCLLFLLTALSMCIPATRAQGEENGWDLARCIEYARKNNISLNTMRLNAESSVEDLKAARSAVYPDLNASVSGNVSYFDKSVVGSNSFGLNSSFVLYKGGYYTKAIRSGEFACQIANLDVSAAENDITLQITQAYLNILVTNENIAYVRDLVSTSQSQVDQCREKYNTGAVALKDLMQLQANLANDKYSLVTAENAKRQNVLLLKTLLQLPADTAFEVAVPDTVYTGLAVAPLNQAQKTALATMPQIAGGDLLVQQQAIEVERTRSGFLPSISLSGGINTSFSSNTGYNYLYQLSNNYMPQIGLSVSIPIYNRQSNKVSMAKTKIQLEQARLSAESARTDLMQTVEQAYIDLQNARSQFSAAEEQLTYARESFRISEEQLRIGSNNNVEYLQQKNLYIQSLQTYIQSKYAVILYSKIYHFYQGIPVTG